MKDDNISMQTMRRLPVYLHYLKTIRDTQAMVSATGIAESFGLNDVQVRKDLGAVSGTGRPRTGYVVEELIAQIEDCLGCRRHVQAMLIGVGHLGKALLSYEGFRDYGIDIVAGFDVDEGVVGTRVHGKPVLGMDVLETVCRGNDIRLAILTAPVREAQPICDRLVACGVRAILNFAPTILKAPPGVAVENENLASSLAVLSKQFLDKEAT